MKRSKHAGADPFQAPMPATAIGGGSSPNASRAWPGNAVAASSKSARSASLNIRGWSNKPNRAVNTDCFHRVGSGARR